MMTTKMVLNKDSMRIEREQDVVPFRNRVKEYAVKIGMGLVNQTKLITAASELVRNMLKYAGGGTVLIEAISQGRESGIRLTFQDKPRHTGHIPGHEGRLHHWQEPRRRIARHQAPRKRI